MVADIATILNIGMKSLGVIQSLAQNGKDIMPAVTAARNVFSKDVSQITEADLDEVEATLDAMLDEFEKPLQRTE